MNIEKTNIPQSPNHEFLKSFPSESQHSFSYAFISQSSISSRLDILKRSLEFLKSNPSLANFGKLNSSSSTTALEGFFKSKDDLSNQPSLRSSASSAALSMLTNYTSLNAAEPSLTAFDTNLKSILVLLENAHVFPSPNSAKLLPQRTITNPPMLLSNSIAPPRPKPRIPSDSSGRSPIHQLKSNENSFRLQSHLLEALATPYMDTMELSNPTTSSLFHPLSSKFSSNQSVFTTFADLPYTILTGNEMGCLVFGMSYSEIRKLSIIDLIGDSHKDFVKDKIPATPNTVFLCGEILPIKKYNGQTGYSSFWAKCHGPDIITWVIEEVVCTISTLTVDLSSAVVTKKVDKENLLPPLKEKILIHDIISGLPQDINLIPSVEHHVTISGGEIVPCAVKYIQSPTPTIELITLPHIAGVIVINSESYEIEDYNSHFFSNLFGYPSTENCRSWSIDDIIPHFTTYLDQITATTNIDKNSTGLVLPEHLFRKMAAQRETTDPNVDSTTIFRQSKGIEGLHMDGHLIIIDVQVRVLGGPSLVLWVTYSRNVSGVLGTTVPSQLTLLSMKKKIQRPSSSRSETPVIFESSSLPKIDTALDNSSEKPKTPTSPKPVQQFIRTPRDQVVRSRSTSVASPASPYSAHITELGARRRKKTLADFEILQKMGEGAHGRVLLAEYKEEPRLKVVLKCIIKERILVDAWTRDRKLGTIPSEIKIMAVLNQWNHENIMQLLDFFEDDEFYHIEMEPHGNPGTDLFDLIELQPRMPEDQVRGLFRQVVSAVRHLHSHDIVHRDIKDENIIVDGLGLVKLIDFGSAAFIKSGPFDVFVGTIDYAAPEVLAGNQYLGKPQDVWALGILLYTIVYKENPFYSVDEIMDQKTELRIPFTTSEECLDLVKSILKRNVEERLTVEQVWNHPWLAEL